MRTPKNGTIILHGYFGCGNIGDEAVLSGLLHGLKDEPFEPVVLSGNPSKTSAAYNRRAVPRKALSAIKAELSKASALVFGGGSLLQDVTSLRSLFYYLYLMRLGKQLCGNTILLAQGFGPLKRCLSRVAVKWALKYADAVAVRDPKSLELVQSLGYKNRLELTADMAWLLPFQSGTESPRNTVVISPRPVKQILYSELKQKLADIKQALSIKGFNALGLAMDCAEDVEIVQSLNASGEALYPQTPESAVEQIAQSHSVIAMRLHTLILASISGVPSIAVSYDPKVSAFTAMMGIQTFSLKDFNATSIVQAWQQILDNRDELSALLKEKGEQQKRLAQRNIALLREVIV